MTFLDENLLGRITNSALFYPHSGRDYRTPIRYFSPHITDFWFADWGYFGLNEPADQVEPILALDADYQLLKVAVEGLLVAEKVWIEIDGERVPWLEPCLRTEAYLHLPSQREIRLHRRRGFSVRAFWKLPHEQIGVFFYRGDSSEGSSVAWLRASDWSPNKRQQWLIHSVLDKLMDGGFVVTDGSRSLEGNCENSPYLELGRFHMDGEIKSGAVNLANPFEDVQGRKFKCVGYVGESKGPTLVWQVTK